MTPGLTPTNFHPLEISRTSASNNTPTASYKQSFGESTATFAASHPLEISQTNASSNTPTASHEPSLGESATTPEASGRDKVQGGGAVFYVENDSSMTDVLEKSEEHIEMLRRENKELVRRLSESEDSVKKVHQQSTDWIEQIRAESFEFKQNEIKKFLTEITEQHKEELKQRMTELERENQQTLQKKKKRNGERK